VPVSEHRLPKLGQTEATSHPSGRDDHCKVTGFKALRLLDEVLVDRNVPGAAIRLQLIWRVADDDVELHVGSEQLRQAGLDVLRMDECVGVGLETFASIEGALAGATELALSAGPRMLGSFEPDVARGCLHRGSDGVLSVRPLRAVQASSCEQARQFSDCDPEHLVLEDVVDAALQIGHLRF